MTIDDIVKQIATKNTFYNDLIIRYFPVDLQGPVISELAVAYLKDRKKMNKIIKEGNFKGYFARSIYFYSTKANLKSILNSENTISRLSNELDGTQYDIEDTQSTFFEEMNDLLIRTRVSFRDALVFKLVFLDGLTYRDITKQYGWSPSTISRSIQSSIQKIKNEKSST